MPFFIIGGTFLFLYVWSKMSSRSTGQATARTNAQTPAPISQSLITPSPAGVAQQIDTIQQELAALSGAAAPLPANIPRASRRTVPTLAPEEALREAMQGESSRDFNNSAWIDNSVRDVRNMWPFYITPEQLSGYRTGFPSNPEHLSQPNGDLRMISTVSGLALATGGAIIGAGIAAGSITSVAAAGGTIAALGGAAGAATAAAAAIPFIGIGIAGIVGIFTIIHSHHASAVKQEQDIFYSINPAAFNTLQIIRASVLNGQASPSEAIHALDSLFADYSAAAAPSVRHNPCNANCEGVTVLHATVIYWKSYYNDMIIQGATS